MPTAARTQAGPARADGARRPVRLCSLGAGGHGDRKLVAQRLLLHGSRRDQCSLGTWCSCHRGQWAWFTGCDTPAAFRAVHPRRRCRRTRRGSRACDCQAHLRAPGMGHSIRRPARRRKSIRPDVSNAMRPGLRVRSHRFRSALRAWWWIAGPARLAVGGDRRGTRSRSGSQRLAATASRPLCQMTSRRVRGRRGNEAGRTAELIAVLVMLAVSLGTPAAAVAGSSATLYGKADVAIASEDTGAPGDSRRTVLNSGNQSSSRLGIRGAEGLNAGRKAVSTSSGRRPRHAEARLSILRAPFRCRARGVSVWRRWAASTRRSTVWHLPPIVSAKASTVAI